MAVITQEEINESLTLNKYKDTMRRVVKMYYPDARDLDINNALDYSINKRYKSYNVELDIIILTNVQI